MSHQLGTELEIGAIFQDRYRILQQLSAGGFGVVYKAEQLTTGQAVAIKCLQRRGRTPAEDQKILARFRRETRLCAKLHHPNIVRLIDSGQSADDVLYTVFEYVPGHNLRQLLAQEGRLGPVEAKHLMAQVLDALSCAHGQGIIHRDLKPANIMVVPTGARRNAMVLDFGIGALSREMQGADYDDLTTTMGRLGTPAYSSPEQLRGHEVTPHSDLYSWGLVFLECLTGQRAIQGGSVAEIMHRQLSPDPVLIPQSLRNHCLSGILRIATAKNLAHRQVSAARLLAQLERCQVADVELAPADDGGAIAMQDPEELSTLALPETPSEDALIEAFSNTGDSGHAESSSDALSTGPHALEMTGERRQITVVSCSVAMVPAVPEAANQPELAHLADLADLPDLEDMEELLAEHVGLCADVARRLGSYIAGESDDHVTLYHGYPRARGDDARRALRAALAIADQIASRNPELGAARGVRAEVRIGVHSGVVLVKPRDRGSASPRSPQSPKISGNTPRIAAQLAAGAAPGTVVASAATCKLVRGGLELEALEPRQVRGLTRPLDVFRVAGVYRHDDIDSITADSDSTPLVGRQHELAALERHWALARGSHGQAVLLSGDAGIGKSRLVRELGRRLRTEPLGWLECRCMEDSQNSPLRPMIELIERLLGTPVHDADKARALDALLARHRIDLARARPVLAPLLSLPPDPAAQGPAAPVEVSPQRQRELTLSAIQSLLIEMSADEPQILVIEDVHWADPSTMELLTMLLGEVPMAPMLVLLTARAGFEPPWSAADIAMMRLDRLGQDTVAEMITRAAGNTPLPEAVIAEIAGRTEGVPLFIEEMVQAVLESGALERRGGGYRLRGGHELARGDASPGDAAAGGPAALRTATLASAAGARRGGLAELGIPATLRDLLMARLDGLDDGARSLAQLGAVLGREFSYELLLCASQLDDASLRAAMSQLTGAGLVHHRRRLSGDSYVFKHALIQEAAYDSLPRTSRQRYHRHIAEAIEGRFPELVHARPELLARHFAGGGDLPRALELMRGAAMGALSKSANHEAMGHARQAIDWLDALDDPRQRAEMELSFYAIIAPAMLGTQGHGHDEFVRWAERAEELMRVAGDGPYTLSTLWGLWLHHFVCARYDEAERYAREQVACAERSGDRSARAAALNVSSTTLFYMGRLVEARDHARRCLALYTPEMSPHHRLVLGHDSRATQQGTLGQALWLLGQPVEARRLAEEGLVLTRMLEHPMSTCFSLFHLAHVLAWDGDQSGVRAAAQELQDLGQRHGLTQWILIAEFFFAAASNDAGRGQAALDQFRAVGQSIGQTYWAATIAESQAAAGHLARAIALLRETIDIAEREGERFYYPSLHILLGRCLLAQDPPDAAAAEASLRRAIAIAREQTLRMPELQATIALCRLLAREPADGPSRDPARREAREALAALYAGFDDSHDHPVVAEARALLES